MANDGGSNWGQPRFLDSSAPDVAVNPTLVSNYFAPIAPRLFATLAALLASTPPAGNYIARAADAPGAWFINTGSGWQMYGTPEFPDTTTRDNVLTSPATGNRCRVGVLDYTYRAGGWRRTTPGLCTVSRSTTQTLANAGTDYAIGFDVDISDVENWHDPAANNSRILAPVAGLYEVTYSIYFALTTATQIGTASVRRNGTDVVIGSLDRRFGGASLGVPLRVTTPAFVMAAGDYIEIIAQASVAAAPVQGTGGIAPSATLKYLGPSA